MPRIAVLQMTSGIDPEANFATIANAMRTASQNGATMLFTPEMSLLLDRDRARARPHLMRQDESLFISRLQQLVDEACVVLALGSMAVRIDEGTAANRSMLFRPTKQRPLTYDKMHMFDVALPTGERWQESAAYRAGDTLGVVEDTPVGRLGLAVCYDLRFPALFAALADRECDVLSVPAAFTVPTGRAHWHILLRARAIEASAYVVAAAQCGPHADGRETFGHSLVIDPWGDVVLDLGNGGEAIGYADISFDRIAEVREQVPSLANRRAIAPSP